MRRVVILGAGGRDFHDFNMVYRDDPATVVVAFTAAQIPGIDRRTYPPELAGPRYPDGIPIRPEAELATIIRSEQADEVVLAYSDLAHEDVMHKASLALAAGVDFRLLGPRSTMLHSAKPVVAVCGVRTGVGKSQTSRRIGRMLVDHGLRVAFVRHPMPYGDLLRMRTQRFATLHDVDASRPTIEEREEYEAPVRLGIVVHAGVDYGAVLAAAEADADVIVWDGGNNDLPFVAPELTITVTDALRPGHETRYHPGETNLRMADVVVVNKVDSAAPGAVEQVVGNVRALNPEAVIVTAASPVTLGPGPALAGARVLVVEDGPTLTHGGMASGAGTVAARRAGAAELIDPRPFAVRSIAETYASYPHIGPVLPAVGYSEQQRADLAETIRASGCDVVVAGTPIDFARVVDTHCPVRRATYELREVGPTTLEGVLAPLVRQWTHAR
jgi:predicted GTPase